MRRREGMGEVRGEGRVMGEGEEIMDKERSVHI